MSNWKYLLKRAKKSKSPIKNSILAYIHVNSPVTAKQTAKSLRLKHTTVRSYLTKLFHEAEVDFIKFDDNGKTKGEKRWIIESEWNEQPSIMNGLFMTQKVFNEFKKTNTYKDVIRSPNPPERIHDIIMEIKRND